MTNLKVLQGGQANEEIYIDSLEVAEMTGKLHKNLLRDIENYTEVLLGSKLSSANFFVESNYQDSTGRTNKSYLLTRKGCDMVANKMTGEKGILFTATYVPLTFTPSAISSISIPSSRPSSRYLN
ncbi:hypothetical protein CON53_09155 [Bacillus cereus]|nr:hypothetical protein CON53_09155 [Bacillus cereus]